VGIWAELRNNGQVIAVVGQVPISEWVTWTIIYALAALGLSASAWGLAKISLPPAKQGPFWLKRLWWFIGFWRWLFKPFSSMEQSADQRDAAPLANEPSSTDTPSEKREIELLKSIVQFGDVTVKQVMQPRSKVVYVDFRASFHALLDVVRSSEFSRLPVCDEDLDNVTGILYVKDLVPYLDESDGFEWQKLIRTNVLMVPEAKPGSELLREFKAERMHMAFVVDEYGGIEGIVTMEDILEEVTGDIRDEFDEDSEIRFRKLDENNYLFEGQTLLNDVCRITGISPAAFEHVRGNADTLAGLALELRGDIPLPGTELAWDGFSLTVTRASNRMVEQVKFTISSGR
jgi:CBS domain containing-hemolysin-like protein